MQSVMNDFRLALRKLRKAKGFTIAVVLILAMGVTATTVVFSVVEAVLLRPLPFPQPDRLVSLHTLQRSSGTKGAATIEAETSYPNFFDWQQQSKSFASIASYERGGLILRGVDGGPARHVSGIQVSSTFFETLGISPELGRGFLSAEEQPGVHVAIISHDTWQNDFAGARDVLGKSIVLSDVTYTIVGVMPREFSFPVENTDAAFWISMSQDAEGKNPSTQQRGNKQLEIVGRLCPGVTLQRAQAEMSTIQRALAMRYPDDDGDQTDVSVVPELQNVVGKVQAPLQILFGAVCCLLLIVCANVAGLMLTRTNNRRGELAIRMALGANRTQMMRQLLVESLVLSLLGGLTGLDATWLILKIVPELLPSNVPRIEQISLSAPVLVFAFALCIVTGLLFGAFPAWLASNQSPSSALSESGRHASTGRKQYRLHSILIVFETALGIVLLVGAGLLMRSFDRTLKVDPGFSPQNMLTFRVSIPDKRYTTDQQTRFFEQLLSELKALPGVEMVTAAYPMPLTGADYNVSFTIPGSTNTPHDSLSARLSLVEPAFFETLKIPLKRGRLFLSTEYNANGVRAVIVNVAFAQQYFPGENAIGKHIEPNFSGDDNAPMREIVGIVGNVKRGGLTENFKPEYYIPYEQAPTAIPSVAMRVSGEPLKYSRSIEVAVARLDNSLPIYRLRSYTDDLQFSTAQQRFQAILLTSFAAIALVLAAIGLYALQSYMVSQRTTELGLRIALGAQRSQILKLMLFHGLKLSLIGLCAGLVAAVILTQSIAGLLYGVKPLDLITFIGMTVLLLLVACAAGFLPAYRASMIDPNKTLRDS